MTEQPISTLRLLDPEVDAVFALRGGWGASRLLPFIDFDVIRDNPKIMLGYSDITSLLNAIYAKQVSSPSMGLT